MPKETRKRETATAAAAPEEAAAPEIVALSWTDEMFAEGPGTPIELMVARDRALQKADLTTVAKIEAALGPSYRFKWNEKYAGEGFQAILDLYGEFIGMRRETGASTTFREFVQKSAPERIEAVPRGGRPATLCSGNPEAVRCCSLRDEGLSVGQIAIKTGLSERQVRSRLEVIPPSNPSQKSK